MTYRTAWLFGAGYLLIGVVISAEIAEASEAPIRPGDRVVTTTKALVKVGSRTLATVPAGRKMTATAVKGDWVAVTIAKGGKSVTGWIHKRHFRRIDSTAQDNADLQVIELPDAMIRPRFGRSVGGWYPGKPPSLLNRELPDASETERALNQSGPAEPSVRAGVPAHVRKALGDTSVKIAWLDSDKEAELVDVLETQSDKYNIVVLDKVELSPDTSRRLRVWMQQGGVVWAFDRVMAPTWKNKTLFEGFIDGANSDAEDPDNAVAWIDEGKLLPCDKSESYAIQVNRVFLDNDHSARRDPKTGAIDASARVFAADDKRVVGLLKGQSHGPAYINLDRLYEYRFLAGNVAHHLGVEERPADKSVIVGFAKKVGRGVVVVLPSIDLEKGDGARFIGNLVEWCLAKERRE